MSSYMSGHSEPMKLWKPQDAPVGGWYWIIEHTDTDFDGKRVPVGGFASGLEDLCNKADAYLQGNGVTPPEYLCHHIEDQICRRQPADRCRYSKKLGDLLSKGIQFVAGAIDKVAGTQLQQKARRCGTCGKRRVKLNNL
jgi:hypothetical protein